METIKNIIFIIGFLLITPLGLYIRLFFTSNFDEVKGKNFHLSIILAIIGIIVIIIGTIL